MEPLGQVSQKFQKVTPKQLPPPSEPPARRLEDTSVARRVFAVGLIGVAALSGAGGWYLLSPRFSRATSPVIASNTRPPATQTTINNQKGLIFTGHLASVNALAWSPDGKFIASASDDTFVQVFESDTGTRKIIYRGHTEEVAAVAWSPDGQFIASAGQDKTVQIWNAASGGSPVLTYKGHTDRVNSVSWSSDGHMLASGSDDRSVQVWQASSTGRVFTFLGHTAGVLCVGWQPDDSSVASGSWDGTLRDWATVQHGDHFDAGEQIFKYGGHGNIEVYALAWSPDGNFIVSAGADQTVQISNGGDGTPRPPFFTDHRRKDHANRVFAVSWSPDGTSIASGDEDGNVYVWRTAGRKTFFKYSGHKGAVNAVAWSPDGNFIASASADNTVHIWQPA
jgi:WD40 repeat protein